MGEKRFCTNCGNKLNTNVRFCSFCGEKVVWCENEIKVVQSYEEKRLYPEGEVKIVSNSDEKKKEEKNR